MVRLRTPGNGRKETDVVESIRRSLETGGYAGRGARLLVGVSGGPDSTALLAGLIELRTACDLTLHVTHVDHGLRPESRGDAAYVRRLGARWSVPVSVQSVDIAAVRRAERVSVEEAARNARHRVFLQAAAAVQAEAIVLGHTADDDVETVLLNLLRGTGLRGLAGMAMQTESAFSPERRGADSASRVPIIRPLLGVRRADVMRYLTARRLRPRQDASNTDPAHLRNSVRHELLPLMEDMRAGAFGAVRRASGDARLALDALSIQADALPADAVEMSDDGRAARFNRRALSKAHPAVRHIVLERAIVALLGSAVGMSQRNYRDIDDMIMNGRTGSEIALPKGLCLSCVSRQDAVLAAAGASVVPPLPPLVLSQLCPEGQTRAGGWVFTARRIDGRGIELRADGDGAEHLPGPMTVTLQPDAAQHGLVVRPRRPGDRIRLRGGSRKVQDVFVDSGIPRPWRDRIPVVAETVTGEILWLTGVAVAAHAAVIGEGSMDRSTIDT